MKSAAARNTAPLTDVTALVLAGGLGRRMGGKDKGLVELAGRPMVEFVLEALGPQVGRVLINANRNLERYAAYGHAVIADRHEGFLGPLAGVLSGLEESDSRFLLTAPCDAPLVAHDLATRLHRACVESGADLVVASDGNRLQPVFMLLERRLRPGLEAFLAGGGRKIDAWFQDLNYAVADLSDCPDCFININDPDERQRAEASLLSRPGASR
ncbi:MAG TPA: molybdenum cofactor guanylyltransferase MobA [Steroidobacteraceae bacterium]|nr:molybdenum cofactor guanylyltransferase MobA [Steroidobacteraceae bacterium]